MSCIHGWKGCGTTGPGEEISGPKGIHALAPTCCIPRRGRSCYSAHEHWATGLSFKAILSNFTREWTRSGRAIAGPKGIHALVPPCFTCLCGRFCDCAHDQQGTEDTLKQFLQGHSIDMRSYVMYTWVERMRHHRTGRGDLRTKGHPCTGPNMLHTPTW